MTREPIECQSINPHGGQKCWLALGHDGDHKAGAGLIRWSTAAAPPEPQGTDEDAEWLERHADDLVAQARFKTVQRLREIAARLRSPAAGASEAPSGEPVAVDPPNTRGALNLIAAERRRQIERHGWTVQHDDHHQHGEMAIEAARYATDGTDAWVEHPDDGHDSTGRPDNTYEHPGWTEHESRMQKSEMRRLVIAGALIVAEIERMVRAGEPYPDVPLPPAPTQREGTEAPKCAICGKPATCFGSYEELPAAFACDECCGHGNEDGWCVPLAEIPEAQREPSDA